MSSSCLLNLLITCFVLILVGECVHHPYLYDDGHDGEEHCCLVRIQDKFCKATPITRSLLQVTKECSRFGGRKRNNDYVDQLIHRLSVEKVYENEQKIFIQLQKPLKQKILRNDLICYKSNEENQINFEKCYIESTNNSTRETKDKQRNHRIRGRSDEEEISRIALSEPIRIREGRGLSFFKYYQIKPDQIRPETSEQRRCWSWYRDRTRKIRRNPSKHSRICISLNPRREQCLTKLIPHYFNDIVPLKYSFLTGSKLFCKTEANDEKFLGHYNKGKICFEPDNQISLEYQFHDIARLSDQYKNQETLDFLDSHKKFRAEFEDDCLGKRNLVEDDENDSATTTSNKDFERN